MHGFKLPVAVQVQGGASLELSFEDTNGSFGNVRLTGPGDFVFEGRIEV